MQRDRRAEPKPDRPRPRYRRHEDNGLLWFTYADENDAEQETSTGINEGRLATSDDNAESRQLQEETQRLRLETLQLKQCQSVPVSPSASTPVQPPAMPGESEPVTQYVTAVNSCMCAINELKGQVVRLERDKADLDEAIRGLLDENEALGVDMIDTRDENDKLLHE